MREDRRDALERFRRREEPTDPVGEDEIIDLITLAQGFAAEHPKNDDDEVTPEWFVATYGNKWVRIEPVRGGPIVLLEWDPDFGCDGWSIDGATIPPMDTRGQLRRLINALKGE
jgi:hypothetical protein